MNAIEIMEALKGKKGQHVKAVWQRVCKTKKAFDGIVAKRTECYVRSGINYANLANIRQGIEKGEREPVQGLPWGQWREGCVNYIIDLGDKEYIRLYPAVFDNLRANVEYTLNGVPATYAKVEPFLLASEKRSTDDERPECFTVKADSILEIAGE